MATTALAHITGRVARWARERAGLEPAQLAKKMGKGYTAAQILAWERDQDQQFPTFSQAEKLAQQLQVPLAILFMQKPPNVPIPIVDLRTIPGAPSAKPSINFFVVVNENVSRQRWYREVREREEAHPLPFVGRFRVGEAIATVAPDIAKTLGITDELRRKCDTWETFLTQFIQHVENAGILVMRSGWAKHAWSRSLEVEEFRGFAVSDVLAPLIFINSADAKAAQIFTLAHEVAHIWIGQSGISNPRPKVRAADFPNPIERYCNAVAAELLIPAEGVKRLWDKAESTEININQLATFHKVSKIAAAIRARDLGMITPAVADRIIDTEYERLRKQQELQKQKAKEKEGGPGFWRGFTERVSARFVDSVIAAVEHGEILYKEAADLLGVKLSTFDKHPLIRRPATNT